MVYNNQRSRGTGRGMGRGNNRSRGGRRYGDTSRNRRTEANHQDASSNRRGGRGRGRGNNLFNRRQDRRDRSRHTNNRGTDETTDIQELRRTIISLQTRLDNLQAKRTDSTSSNAQPASGNRDFAEVTKSIYKLVQLQYHQTNWQQLPKSLDQRINRLADDIKPPNAGDYFRRQIKTLSAKFGDDIRQLVSQHLEQELTHTEIDAGKLDPSDIERAKEIATKYLRNRLGRLDATKRESMVNSSASLVGIYRQRSMATPSRDQMTSPTPTTSHHDSNATQVQPEAWHLVPSSTSNRKRRASGTPECTTVTNRFSALQQDNEELNDDLPATHPVGHKRNKPLTETRTGAEVGTWIGSKENWTFKIAPDTECVVIGDSNLRSISKIPPRWQIESLPGAHLQHVARAVSRIRTSKPEHKINLVIQAGINHRNEMHSNNRADIEHLIHEAHGNEFIGRTFWAGIPTPATLPPDPASTIRLMNMSIIDAIGADNYILPLDQALVSVEPNDKYGIHHTVETSDKIIQKIYKYTTGKDF